MATTPSSSASLRIERASRPWRSARATAVSSTRSSLSGVRGSVTDAGFAMAVRFAPIASSYGVRLASALQRKSRGWRRPHMQNRNLAARAGRWSAHHRRTAIVGWILFVVLAVVAGGRIGQHDLDASASGNGESKRGDMIVAAAGFPKQAGEQVLVQGRGSVKAGDREVTAAVRDIVGRLQRIDGVRDIKRPLEAGSRAETVSRDGRSVVGNFKLPGTDHHVEQLVEQPLAAVAAVQAAHRDVRVEEFGKVSATKAIAAQDGKDGKRSQLISGALMLVILLAAFGAVVAAGLPLVLGATAVAATVGLLGPV